MMTNRECAALRVCDDSSHYEVIAPTKTTNRVCLPLSTCHARRFEAAAPTFNSDRVCESFRECEYKDSYQSAEGTSTSQIECSPLTQVQPVVNYQTVPQTKTSDRTVKTLTVCDSSTQYLKGKTPLGDRNCLSLTQCIEGVSYEIVAPDSESDRKQIRF